MSDLSSAFVATFIGAPLSGSALRELTRATLGRGKPFRFTAHGYSTAPFVNPRSQRSTAHRFFGQDEG